MAGRSWRDKDGFLSVSRLTPDGQLDRSFGSNGFAETGFGRYSNGNAVTVAPDGTIFVAAKGGFLQHPDDIVVVALTENGILDTTFGTGGVATAGGFSGVARDMLRLPDGSLVVAATFYSSSSTGVLVKFDASGNLDNDFGTNGAASIGVGAGYAVTTFDPLDLEVDSAGNLLVATRRQTNDTVIPYATDFFVARFTADGAIDSTFGSGGLAIVANPSWRQREFASLNVRDDDTIQLSAVVSNIQNHHELVVAGLTADGTADPSFALNGIFKSDLGLNWDQNTLHKAPGHRRDGQWRSGVGIHRSIG